MEQPAYVKKDYLLGIILIPLFLVLFIGSMFVTAAYLTPWYLDYSGCLPESTKESLISYGFLVGSMVVGYFVFLIMARLISIMLVDEKTYMRWQAASIKLDRVKGQSKIINKHILWALRPRGYKNPNKLLVRDAPR